MGMRRRIVTFALLLVAVGALAAAAGAEVVQSGDVRVSFDGTFAPRTLPRERAAPISVSVEGKISTTDGSQPPPLRELRMELNSAGQIDAGGLPACRSAQLQSTSSEAALARCRSAQVGKGRFVAQLRLGGKPIVVDGRALVFNGIVGGRPGMLIHIYIAQPVRVTLVVPLRISRGEGKFGTVLRTRVPPLAGGLGSITELQLKIGRRYSRGGERHSYLSAACAAPAGFPGITFSFARGIFAFADGRTMHAVLAGNCQVRK
ncbi:MAG: hypothetical protein JSS97_10740 [Actinobacteria bacterium]|nr:hypothetical protein [Actinomycetota bacterium]